MGSGKSTVGKHLAASLNIPFDDLDVCIENEENTTVSQIFNTKGELYFRKKEYQVLQTQIEAPSSMVLALGGGTPCYGNVMQLLNQNAKVVSVYLDVSIETLTARLFLEKEARPLIAHISEKAMLNDFIRKHLFERRFYYNQATLKISTDEKSLQEIVEEIVAQLF